MWPHILCLKVESVFLIFEGEPNLSVSLSNRMRWEWHCVASDLCAWNAAPRPSCQKAVITDWRMRGPMQGTEAPQLVGNKLPDISWKHVLPARVYHKLTAGAQRCCWPACRPWDCSSSSQHASPRGARSWPPVILDSLVHLWSHCLWTHPWGVYGVAWYNWKGQFWETMESRAASALNLGLKLI